MSNTQQSRVTVDEAPLRELLTALSGLAHHIREIMATRSLHALGHPNCIDTLIEQFNLTKNHSTVKASAKTCCLCDTEFRAWPDGTIQHIDDTPHSHMSDDFTSVWGHDEEDALRRAKLDGIC